MTLRCVPEGFSSGLVFVILPSTVDCVLGVLAIHREDGVGGVLGKFRKCPFSGERPGVGHFQAHLLGKLLPCAPGQVAGVLGPENTAPHCMKIGRTIPV